MSNHQYRFIPAIPMTEEEADRYLDDLNEFHCLADLDRKADQMRSQNASAKRNAELAIDIFKAFTYGTKQ